MKQSSWCSKGDVCIQIWHDEVSYNKGVSYPSCRQLYNCIRHTHVIILHTCLVPSNNVGTRGVFLISALVYRPIIEEITGDRQEFPTLLHCRHSPETGNKHLLERETVLWTVDHINRHMRCMLAVYCDCMGLSNIRRKL